MSIDNDWLVLSAGLLEVYIGESIYKPLISVVDKEPLAIKYVSFDALESSRVLFFYECADRNLVSPAVTAEHPLLGRSVVATKEGNE